MGSSMEISGGVTGSGTPALSYLAPVVSSADTTHFVSTVMVGYGNDYFVGWTAYVIWDAGGASSAPQAEYRVVSDYVSSTGTFTLASASTQLAASDVVVLVHPMLASLGATGDTAATGAVTTTDTLMAYVKQIVTNTYKLAEAADGTDKYPASFAQDSALAKFLTKSDPAVASGYDNTTDSLEAIRDCIDALSLSTTAVGRTQVKSATVDLHTAAGNLTAFTGTTQAVILTGLTVKCPTTAISDDVGGITGISVTTDDATAQTIISTTQGLLANLTTEAELSWTGHTLIPVGTIIRVVLAGGTADADPTNIVLYATYHAVVAGGVLA